jgi:hypothetical protein
MDFVLLTPDQRAAFATDGYLVVRDALDRETVDQLLGETDRLAGAFINKPKLAGKPEYNHLDLRRGLLKEKSLLELVANSTTVPLVVQLLSTNIHLHSTAIIYKRPELPMRQRSVAAGTVIFGFQGSGTQTTSAGRHKSVLLPHRFPGTKLRNDVNGVMKLENEVGTIEAGKRADSSFLTQIRSTILVTYARFDS